MAFPFARVGSEAVGGAEQILGELDAALVDAGHRSLVVACEGSRPKGRLYATPAPPPCVDSGQREVIARQVQAVLDRALEDGVDLVHMHGLDFHQYVLPRSMPVLVTLHLPIDWYPRDRWSQLGPNVRLQCVSASQRATCPPEWNVAVIPNGVEVPLSRPGRKGDYALALGRICAEKNVHEALDAGTRAGTRVLIGGEVFPYADHRRYFEQAVAPRLRASRSGRSHAFLGALDRARKWALLARAKCLLHPTLAPETSSLVAMEALAAGTPVIAYPSGALTEIVDDGVTGFLVNDVAQMAQRLRDASALRPEACRAAAAARFGRARMISRYFALYESMLRGHEGAAAHG